MANGQDGPDQFRIRVWWLWEHAGEGKGLGNARTLSSFLPQNAVRIAPMMAQPNVAYPLSINVSLNGLIP